ncbi:hypothetical protein Hanom_Chr12g01081321 [Helianthus anomalus]
MQKSQCMGEANDVPFSYGEAHVHTRVAHGEKLSQSPGFNNERDVVGPEGIDSPGSPVGDLEPNLPMPSYITNRPKKGVKSRLEAQGTVLPDLNLNLGASNSSNSGPFNIKEIFRLEKHRAAGDTSP